MAHAITTKIESVSDIKERFRKSLAKEQSLSVFKSIYVKILGNYFRKEITESFDKLLDQAFVVVQEDVNDKQSMCEFICRVGR